MALQLCFYVIHLVMRVEKHHSLSRGLLRKRVAVTIFVLMWCRGINTFKLRIDLLKAAQHLVERMVFEDKDDYVLDRVRRNFRLPTKGHSWFRYGLPKYFWYVAIQFCAISRWA